MVRKIAITEYGLRSGLYSLLFGDKIEGGGLSSGGTYNGRTND